MMAAAKAARPAAAADGFLNSAQLSSSAKMNFKFFSQTEKETRGSSI